MLERGYSYHYLLKFYSMNKYQLFEFYSTEPEFNSILYIIIGASVTGAIILFVLLIVIFVSIGMVSRSARFKGIRELWIYFHLLYTRTAKNMYLGSTTRIFQQVYT